MKFGLWYDFRNPTRWRQAWPSLYGDLLQQIRWSESVGFESVWLSEHHFTEDGYMPSVFPTLAAIAAQTNRIRLGTAVCLAPLHHPLRLAEDSAVVDILSNGRLELGIAPGYRTLEFEVLGIPKRERGKRTDETIEILRAAWTGREVSYEGAVYAIGGIKVQPGPASASHRIPIHVGGSSLAAANRAGRLGCNFMPDVGTGVQLHQQYRSALQSSGFDPKDFEITVNGCVYIAEEQAQAWKDVAPHLRYMYDRYAAWAAEAGDSLPATSQIDRESLENFCIIGTPRTVRERLLAMLEELNPDRFIFWGKLPGLPIRKANRSLELFVKEVMPAFA